MRVIREEAVVTGAAYKKPEQMPSALVQGMELD
jgi:hypothetical protein